MPSKKARPSVIVMRVNEGFLLVVGSYEVTSASRKATQARDAIVANANFISTELNTITAPRELKQLVWAWSDSFVEGWGEISAYLDRVMQCGRNYLRMHPSAQRSGAESDINTIRNLMRPLFDSLRKVVEETQARSKQAGETDKAAASLISVLVTESARNILNSAVKLQDALDKLLAEMKIDEPDPYDGELYPHFEFSCANCHHPALELTFVPEDARHPVQAAKHQALLCGHGEVVYLSPEQTHSVLQRLQKGDLEEISMMIDAGRVYCRHCQLLYCWDDWTNKEQIYDEGSYDYTRGVCPQGHKGVIDD